MESVLKKIISGGQTGVDRAALDAARRLNISQGGWCPRGRLAEDGTIPDCYELRQTRTKRYARRTEKNVLDSDATLILCRGKPSGGTRLTEKLAEKHGKPLLVVDLEVIGRGLAARESQELEAIERIRRWLAVHAIETLNVAGPRQSQAAGVYEQALALLMRLFEPLATNR